MESEVKLLHDNGQRRLKCKRVDLPNANTFLTQCPICRKPTRRRKTKQIPQYETYLQIMPHDSADRFTLHFKVWIRHIRPKISQPWVGFQKGGVYKVRLDIWDDFVNGGQGGYIRNPLLNELHWHREEPS